MTSSRGAALAAALALVGGCAWVDGNAVEFRLRELDAARELWLSKNVDSYSYVARRSCECLYTASTRVVVVYGAIARVKDEASGEVLPAEAESAFHTIDGLFDVIADAITRDPHQFLAQYHPDWGYPTLFSVDYDARIADDEIVIRASGLELLPVF